MIKYRENRGFNMNNKFSNLLIDNFYITQELLKDTTLEEEMLKLKKIGSLLNKEMLFYNSFIFGINQIFEGNKNINIIDVSFKHDSSFEHFPLHNIDINLDFDEHHYDASKHQFDLNMQIPLLFYTDRIYVGEEYDEENYGLNLKLLWNRLYSHRFTQDNRFDLFSQILESLKINNSKEMRTSFKEKEDFLIHENIFNHKFSFPIMSYQKSSLENYQRLIKEYGNFKRMIDHTKFFTAYEISKFFFNYFKENKEIKDIAFVVFNRENSNIDSLSEVGLIQLRNNEKVILHKFKSLGGFNDIPEFELMTEKSSYYDFNKENVFDTFSCLLGYSKGRIDKFIKKYYILFEKEDLLSHVEDKTDLETNPNKKRL